jgi:chromosome segregation ATPase
MSAFNDLTLFQQIFAAVDEKTLAVMGLTENHSPQRSPDPPSQPQAASVRRASVSPKRGIPIREASSLIQLLRESPLKSAQTLPLSPVERAVLLNGKAEGRITRVPSKVSSRARTLSPGVWPDTEDPLTLVEELELTLQDNEGLVGKVRTALDSARERREELEQKNSELESVIQQLNRSIGALGEKMMAAEKEYQDREAQNEALWEGRVNELTLRLKALQR